ncbi:P2 family phage major capsid protein [Salmonella enterica]|nr:P2 family phage major capsid protein [Salmonella enterica]EDQ4636892.1 P2 family phage major capsid protein [Salmonella enterica subsp. enterica serovar Arechavaleta]EHP7148161.1 P2 family phage major capsid protein [Salmonella enterica subsp. enterica serovar Thompson]EBI2177047.1 P2 family phage major capsid protein [Salmonella enterica]EBQ7396303.1 P2 family phage major capsid protein [Salmonella enterica]
MNTLTVDERAIIKSLSVYGGSTNEKDWVYFEKSDGRLLNIALTESNWMMKNITLLPVRDATGQAYTVGSRQLHTGREISGRFRRRISASATPYELVETDTCAFLPYQDLVAMINTGKEGELESKMEAFFDQAVALDMLRIGFNGQRVGWPTKPDENPNGEDINKGWHTIAKAFNKGSQVLTDAITLGGIGSDFPHLDALANHIIQTKIPEGLREDPRLVVMVGSELAAAERLRLFNGADTPANAAAAQSATSSIAGRFAFVPPFMPGKRLVVTTLSNLHIYTQEGTQKTRAEFNDEESAYEQSYLRSEGYALQDGMMYAAVDESAITLKS